MTAIELIGLITGIITILGVVVTMTRYITQLQFKIRQERLVTEMKVADKAIGDLEAKNKELLNEIARSKRIGTAALNRKMEIDDDLLMIMKKLRAKAGSIFAPHIAKTSSKPMDLVFISIQPSGKQSAKLKKKIIPIRSNAGRCFITETPYITTNPKTDPEHYDKADMVSGYHTMQMLNYPLRHHGETVGVLQLLNKEDDDIFTEDDIKLIESLVLPLSRKVSDFIHIPENYEILGITPEEDMKYATVMFCDLTRSLVLFQELNISAAIQHINEYFEVVCDIALSHGATVDKYMGDGVLLRFNVPRPITDHPHKAIIAALEMRDAFEKLKLDWITMGDHFGDLFIRIGIAYGQVHQAVVGHPQYQYLTIFGDAVNVSVNLCEVAERERNIIVIDENVYNELSGKIFADQLSKKHLGKAISYIESAYELRGLIS